MTETRTIVTVHPHEQKPVTYSADDYGIPGETMGLNIVRDDTIIATWAPGTWARVEITEEPTEAAEPPHATADRIARGYYEAYLGSELAFEQEREAHGKNSVAVLLTAAALDGINARESVAAEPETTSGTFEVYEDNRGKFRFRLRTADGEVVASGQAYASRGGARQAVAAVQRAANGARIVDVDGEGR